MSLKRAAEQSCTFNLSRSNVQRCTTRWWPGGSGACDASMPRRERHRTTMAPDTRLHAMMAANDRRSAASTLGISSIAPRPLPISSLSRNAPPASCDAEAGEERAKRAGLREQGAQMARAHRRPAQLLGSRACTPFTPTPHAMVSRIHGEPINPPKVNNTLRSVLEAPPGAHPAGSWQPHDPPGDTETSKLPRAPTIKQRHHLYPQPIAGDAASAVATVHPLFSPHPLSSPACALKTCTRSHNLPPTFLPFPTPFGSFTCTDTPYSPSPATQQHQPLPASHLGPPGPPLPRAPLTCTEMP
eukprot:352195-Chlamydomonas_euryale.AAC.7